MDKGTEKILARLAKLEDAVFGGSAQLKADKATEKSKHELDFSLNERAFIKTYFSKFNGQESFTLICAYLSKGKEDVSADLSEIKNVWKRCLGIIGYPYSSIYSTRAKENGWVNVSEDARATYVLGKQWQTILKHD
jgi:hypothetical protein